MTLFKSIWYVTVTASTVGYGDLSPVSFMGKVTGIVIIVVGVEFFLSKINMILTLLRSYRQGHGRFSPRTCDHVIVTGALHPASARDFIQEFAHRDHQEHARSGLDVCVLTDAKLEMERFLVAGTLGAPRAAVQFLSGDLPTHGHRLSLARAQAVFFFADARRKHGATSGACARDHDNRLVLRAVASQQLARSCKRAGAGVEVYLTVVDRASLGVAASSLPGAVALCQTALHTALIAQSAFCPGTAYIYIYIYMSSAAFTPRQPPPRTNLNPTQSVATSRRQSIAAPSRPLCLYIYIQALSLSFATC